MVTRRRFVCAGALAAAVPSFAVAQPPSGVRRLCWLSSGTTLTESYNAAFLRRLGELGYVKGRNLAVEFRTAEGNTARLGALAADLGRLDCDVFLAPGTEANLLAVESATRERPIVIIATDYDPVATGHVTNLARPGGRITGMSHLQAELPGKRLALLKEMLPGARRVAVLSDPVAGGQLAITREAAKSLHLALDVHEFRAAPYDYEGAFAALARGRPDALLVLASGIFAASRKTIPALALRHGMPSMFNNRLWAEAGGLVSYGVNFERTYERAAEQVAMILGGTRPGDIPLEQASAVELVVNLTTAKALKVTVPPGVLARADRLV